VTITAGHVAALRAALAGDAAGFEWLAGQSGSAHGEEFPGLMTMAFVAAVRRRFPAGWSAADVITFVGRVRAGESGQLALSPTLAEQLILSALRSVPLRGQPDETATACTQFVLLRELVSDLDGDQLSTLLAGARDDAERVGRPARPASR
jgi:hypothetical protein